MGQEVHGVLAEPVFAYDSAALPAGTEVIGTITEIQPVKKRVRLLQGLNEDFSPKHRLVIQFSRLRLSNGNEILIRTAVSEDGQQLLRKVAADASQTSTRSSVAASVKRSISDAKKQLRIDWENAKSEVRTPGRLHRLEHAAIEQLPLHPQYLEKGTRFTAEIEEPVPLPPAVLGKVSPPGSQETFLHAALKTPLSSATARQGDSVEAVLTEPFFQGENLLYPAGSVLRGSVIQVRAARGLHHNGQLRISFNEVSAPGVKRENIASDLQGVELPVEEQVQLDAEGGAVVKTPKSRYLKTALSVGLAASPFYHEREHGVEERGLSSGQGAASGASGYRLIGTILGTFAHSRALSATLGIGGAASSVYSHFLARGRDVVYPANMSMIISIREAHP